MSKDSSPFSNFRNNQSSRIHSTSQVKQDPFLFVNRIVRERIKEERMTHLVIPLAVHAIAAVLVQPLNVVGTLLQLSVKEHKNIYKTPSMSQFSSIENSTSNPKIQTTSVSRINKDITMIEKKKMELQMLSGVKHKPFTAPVYSSYMETIRDLYQQGFKSFFKGTLSTTILQFYRSSLRYGILAPYIYQQYGQVHKYTDMIVAYSALTFADILLNYVHMIESRFILQSSAPQFSTYRNIKQFISSNWGMKRWMTTGWKTHFLRNIYIIGSNQYDTAFLFTLNYLISYPINTAYKRMLCQSEEAGMIPTRYSSVWHCFKLTLQEEGIRGLYRGFFISAARQLMLFNVFRLLYFSLVYRTNSYWMSNFQQSRQFKQ